MVEMDIPEPPTGLDHQIMRRINRYERRVLVAKLSGFGVLFVSSVAALTIGYFNLMSALTQSGFFEFISLFFSDFGAAVANFQDFAFSVIESFPVFSAAFLVGGVIAVVWSATHLVNDISEIRTHRGFITA